MYIFIYFTQYETFHVCAPRAFIFLESKTRAFERIRVRYLPFQGKNVKSNSVRGHCQMIIFTAKLFCNTRVLFFSTIYWCSKLFSLFHLNLTIYIFRYHLFIRLAFEWKAGVILQLILEEQNTKVIFFAPFV